MFDEIGGKIKTVAKIGCWIGIIFSIIEGCISIYATEEAMPGIAWIIGGALASWIGSFLLVGFGELIEATCETRDLTYEFTHRKGSVLSANEPAPVTVVRSNSGAQTKQVSAPAGGWICDCGRTNASYVSTCVCGRTKNEKKQESTDAQ